jgi:hypothetical protein
MGDMVQGGKPEYWVLWDVLKDVDELKSADFIVRAELKEPLKQPKSKQPIFNLAPAIQFPGPGFGARFGVMGKFGVSLQFISWKADLIGNPVYTGDTGLKRYSIALASRIMNKIKASYIYLPVLRLATHSLRRSTLKLVQHQLSAILRKH